MFFDIFTQKLNGSLVKLDSLNRDELDVGMLTTYRATKYSNLTVVRNDGKKVVYDAVGDEWKKRG